MPDDRPTDPTTQAASPGTRGPARWIDPRIDTQPQQVVAPARGTGPSGRTGQRAETAAPQQNPPGPPMPRYYTVPSVQLATGQAPSSPSRRRPHWWVLHVIMLGVIALLLVVPFFLGMVAVALDPQDESWVPALLVAWLLAVLLIPIWIAWSIVRGIRWRSRSSSPTV